jgi:hypothetical protein
MHVMAIAETSSEDPLFLDKVMRARQMNSEKKFLLGPRLYEYARGIAMAAIRAEHPDAPPEEQRRLFQRRLQIARWLEENPI